MVEVKMLKIFYSVLILAIGASLGSFFKLIVDRFNTEESLIFKSSYCNNCKKKLFWWQNIPIVSYFMLGGKCYFCKSKLSISHPFVEILVALLIYGYFVSFYFSSAPIQNAVPQIFLLFLLILLSMFDLKHRIIPHEITYLAIIILVLYKLFFTNSIISALAALGIAFLFMDILHILVALIKRLPTEQNRIIVPILFWSIFSLFYVNQVNFYFLLLSIFIYYLTVRIKLNPRLNLLMWLSIILFLIFFIFQILFVSFNTNVLSLYFFGVGLIYFICEILFYFLNSLYVLAENPIPVESSLDAERFAIGGGDITVFALVSLSLGLKLAFLSLFIASLIAILSHFVIRNIVIKCSSQAKQNSQYLPFVPYISIACFIIILVFNGK